MYRLENLRSNYNIDNPSVIYNNNSLNVLYEKPVITTFRDNNFITSSLEGRRVKNMHELQRERTIKGGIKRYINLNSLISQMKRVMVKVPVFNKNGNIEKYLGTDRVKTIDIPLFSLLLGISTMSPKNRVVALEYSINNMLDYPIRGSLIDSLRILVENLTSEMKKQSITSLKLIALINEANEILKKKKSLLATSLGLLSTTTPMITPITPMTTPMTTPSIKIHTSPISPSLQQLVIDFDKLGSLNRSPIISPYKFKKEDYDFNSLILKLYNYKISKNIEIVKDVTMPMGKYQKEFSKYYDNPLMSYDISKDDYKTDYDSVQALADVIRANIPETINLGKQFKEVIRENKEFHLFPIHRILGIGGNTYGFKELNVLEYMQENSSWDFLDDSIDYQYYIMNHSLYYSAQFGSSNQVAFRTNLEALGMYLYDLNYSSFNTVFNDFVKNKNSFFMISKKNIIYDKNIEDYLESKKPTKIASVVSSVATSLSKLFINPISTGFLLQENEFSDIYDVKTGLFVILKKYLNRNDNPKILIDFIIGIIDPIVQKPLFDLFYKEIRFNSFNFDTSNRLVIYNKKKYEINIINIFNLINNYRKKEPDGSVDPGYFASYDVNYNTTINSDVIKKKYISETFLLKMLRRLQYYIYYNEEYSHYTPFETVNYTINDEAEIEIEKQKLIFKFKKDVAIDIPMGNTSFDDFTTWAGSKDFFYIKKAKYGKPLLQGFIDVIKAITTDKQYKRLYSKIIKNKEEFSFDSATGIIKNPSDTFIMKAKQLNIGAFIRDKLNLPTGSKDLTFYHVSHSEGNRKYIGDQFVKLEKSIKRFYMYIKHKGFFTTTFKSGDEAWKYFTKNKQTYFIIKKHEIDIESSIMSN
jgi:hypothetical protein